MASPVPNSEATQFQTGEDAAAKGHNGGIRSGEVRREKAAMKKTLEMLLDETSKNGKSYKELATLGLIKGAIDGKAENYKVILQVLGELQEETSNETPQVNINIVDNSNLERVLYENNN